MKNRELINLIKDEAQNQQIPDLTQKILMNAPRTLIISETDKENKPISKPRLQIGLRYALTTFALLVCVLAFFIIKPTTTPQTEKGKVNKAYATQTISLVSLASNQGFIQERAVRRSNSEYGVIKSEIEKYLELVDQLYNKEDISYEVLESDKKEYMYKMVLNDPEFNGVNKTYILYYNEDALEISSNIDEASTVIEGIVLVDGVEYTLSGKKEVEKYETEVELKLHLGDNKYVKVFQEIENRDNEYTYEYYENGELIKSYEVEIEEELFKKELSFSVVIGKLIDVEITFEIKNNAIYFEYEKGNKEYNGKINVVENKYNIEFN